MPAVPNAQCEETRRKPVYRALKARWLALGLTLALAGCGILPRNAVPVELMPEASIPGLPDVRAVAGLRSAAMTADLALSFTQ